MAGEPFGTRGGFIVEHNFPADGDYELTIGDMALAREVPRMEFGQGGKDEFGIPFLREKERRRDGEIRKPTFFYLLCLSCFFCGRQVDMDWPPAESKR